VYDRGVIEKLGFELPLGTIQAVEAACKDLQDKRATLETQVRSSNLIARKISF